MPPQTENQKIAQKKYDMKRKEKKRIYDKERRQRINRKEEDKIYYAKNREAILERRKIRKEQKCHPQDAIVVSV